MSKLKILVDEIEIVKKEISKTPSTHSGKLGNLHARLRTLTHRFKTFGQRCNAISINVKYSDKGIGKEENIVLVDISKTDAEAYVKFMLIYKKYELLSMQSAQIKVGF